MTVNKLWIGKFTGLSLLFYGFGKPNAIFIVGGVTILLLTWLHWEVIRKKSGNE